MAEYLTVVMGVPLLGALCAIGRVALVLVIMIVTMIVVMVVVVFVAVAALRLVQEPGVHRLLHPDVSKRGRTSARG